MISETKMHKIGGSLMVIIPDAYVKHFKLDKVSGVICTIEDINDHEAKIVFQG